MGIRKHTVTVKKAGVVLKCFSIRNELLRFCCFVFCFAIIIGLLSVCLSQAFFSETVVSFYTCGQLNVTEQLILNNCHCHHCGMAPSHLGKLNESRGESACRLHWVNLQSMLNYYNRNMRFPQTRELFSDWTQGAGIQLPIHPSTNVRRSIELIEIYF